MWLWLTPSLLSMPHRVMALWCCIFPRFIPLLPGFSIWVQSLPLCYTDRVECFLFAAFSCEWWLSQRCMHFSSFFGTPQNHHHFGFKNQNADKFWHHNKCQIMALIVLRGTNKHVRREPWRIRSFFCCSFVFAKPFLLFFSCTAYSVFSVCVFVVHLSLLFVCLCVFACVRVCVHTHTPCSVFCDRSFFVATARFSLLCVSTSTFILIVFPFFFQSCAIGGWDIMGAGCKSNKSFSNGARVVHDSWFGE
jgi:hypothetical protein